MKKIFHYYSLDSEWLYNFAEQVGSKVTENTTIVFPKEIGTGHCYFTQITKGISAFFINISVNTPLKICRISSENDLYIFHYDLSEHVNLIKINNQDYEIGSYDKLDLAIIDNQIESSYKPALNEQTFALRILVDKKLLTDFISKFKKKEYKTLSKDKIEKEAFYHYGNIDSNSTLLIQSLKTVSIYDLSFESFLKGISLKLLGNFFNRFYEVDNKSKLTDIESNALNKTRDYLLDNIHGPFPSLIFLAAMAGMSETRYKAKFKECFNITPKNFFIEQKMARAKELLQSGKYNSLTEIVYELNYTKLSYFTSKYFELFNRRPNDDFIKNRT